MESRKLQRPQPTAYLIALSLFFAILFLILGFHRFSQLQLNPELNGAVRPGVEGTKKLQVQEAYGKLPLSFIQNDGQIDKQVKFYERGSGHATFFTKDGIYLSLSRRPQSKVDTQRPTRTDQQYASEPKQTLIKLIPIGSNKHTKIVAEGMQEGKVNYFVGNDPKKWKTNVPTYQAVVYQEIYPGIDLKFYGNNRQMEYDVIVKPGADPSKVKLAYEGIEGLRVSDEGDLEISLSGGKIFQKKPVVYQEINGRRVDLTGTFKIEETTNRHPKRSIYGFEVASYDKTRPLVIDPTLVYSTYLGGSDDDIGYGIALDGSGNTYVTGSTGSTDFPTCPLALPVCASTGTPLQAANGGGDDVFVAKFNAAGSALVYSTYLGGSGDDFGRGIAVDGSGNAYVAGSTNSTNLPTMNALQATNSGGNDAFVAKLNPSGSALVYSTYLGGSGDDFGRGIAVDGSGTAYVTGGTSWANFPGTAGSPIQSSYGGNGDAFVAKINATGSALIYSTYLGGSAVDHGNGIAVDGSGNAYVTGYTYYSINSFPTTPGAFQTSFDFSMFCTQDAFVTKLNATGSALVYSTYLGGNRCDYGNGIAVDGSGNAYVTGYTGSHSFPLANALQNKCFLNILPDCSDAFVTKFNATGSALIYSTFLGTIGGGGPASSGYGIAVDGSGNAYVTGYTSSTAFPTCPSSSSLCASTGTPLQAASGGGKDAFAAKINAAGSALEYSTYLGGSGDDIGYGIAVNGLGNAYITGQTGSTNFPTVNALQAGNNGNQDAFVAMIGNVTVVIPAGASLCVPDYSSDCAYSPNPLTINSGDSVVWASADGSILHTATSDDHGDTFMLDQPVPPANSFSTGIITGSAPSAAIGPFVNTLGVSQTKLYHCSVHPAIMKGTLIINPAAVTTTTTTTTSTTTTTLNYPPSADSLAPVNISTAPGVAQSFTASYSDPNGYIDISTATLTFWGQLFGLQVVYHPSGNEFTMAGADGTCAPGQAAVLTDGYLTLNCSSSSVSSSGTILTITYNLTPQPPSSGAPYQSTISVMDQMGASHSKTTGYWIVNRRPSADSVSPANSMTEPMMSQTFTAVYSDPDGWQNIAAANFYLSGNGGTHNEWLHYLSAPNLFTMMGTNDVCSPGQATTLSNGFLTLDCSASSVSGSGNVLTVIFQATPLAPSSGINYNIFTAASDHAGGSYAIFAGTWQIQ